MPVSLSKKLKQLDIIWSDPICKMEIDQTGGNTKFKLEFYFSLPIVRLLEDGIDGFSFAIKSSKNKNEYSYFKGSNIDDIEESIQSFFNSQNIVKSSLNSNYHGYSYEEYSLFKFISDEKIAELSRYNSKHSLPSVTFMQGLTKPSADNFIKNTGEYISLGTSPGPYMDINKNVDIEDPNNFKNYFISVAASHSLSPMQIGNVEFLVNKINRLFKGDNSFNQLKRIKLKDKKYPAAFWSLWKKMFKFNPLDTQLLPTVKKFSSKYFPCKINVDLAFSSNDLNQKGTKARQAIMGLFDKNYLTVEIKLKKNSEDSDYEEYNKDFKIMDILKDMSKGIEDPEIKIINDNFTDTLFIYNPNKFSLFCEIVPIYWNFIENKLERGKNVGILVSCKNSNSVKIENAGNRTSRYYEVIIKNGFFDDIGMSGYEMAKEDSDISTVVPWKTVQVPVPGIKSKFYKQNYDPSIGYYRSNNNKLVIRVANFPPYVDQLKFYIKYVNSTSSGAKRAPGTKREDYIFITEQPRLSNISNPSLIPEAEISYLELVPGNYKILCDLYNGGTLVSTVETIFHKEPVIEASSQGVDFDIKISGGDNFSSNILISETSDDSSSIVNDITNDGSLPEPLDKTFRETFATSKKLTRYTLERFNIESCETEFMGVIIPGTTYEADATGSTTKNHVYIVKQHVVNIGQILTSNAPFRNSSLNDNTVGYMVDYAKFNSAKYLNFQTLPQVNYDLPSLKAESAAVTALKESSTGRYKSKKISKLFKVIPTIKSTSLDFDPIRKSNVLSWEIEWSGKDFTGIDDNSFPFYWLVTAKYGGITAPIIYQISSNNSDRLVSVVDNVLGGSLGTVEYQINCVYSDGSMINSLAQESITISDDEKINITLGRGL